MKTAVLLLLPCALLTAQELHVRSVKGKADVRPDAITTASNSQVEVDLRPSAGFRLQPNSEIRITRTDEGRYRFDLVRGALTYDVTDPVAKAVEVATPSVSAWPAVPGTYEIAVSKSAESTIVARSGHIEVVAPAGSQWVDAGQKMIARGSRLDPQFRIVSAYSVWKRLAVWASNINWGGGASSGDDSSSSSSSDSGGSSSTPAAHSSAAAVSSSSSAAATGSHSGHGK